MQTKTAIAVYNPSDLLEKAVQESFHAYNDGWLTSYECRLFARAIRSLKIFDSWVNRTDLYEDRLKYFFVPQMSMNKDRMVFLTHLLFLREILENRTINNYNYNPVVFMCSPIAHYLFKEYPIQIVVDMNVIKQNNEVLELGGLAIVDSVTDIKDAILDVVCRNSAQLGDVYKIRQETGIYRKVAASQISRGVFKIDEMKREIKPNATIWDKKDRVWCKILSIEPGEMGVISVLYDNGLIRKVSQYEFDKNFAQK